MQGQGDLLEELAANVPAWDRAVVMQAIEHLAGTDRVFTADDLHSLGIPLPPHPNHIGALFSAAHKAGLIQPVGYAPSAREGRNGSVVRTWRGGPE